MLIPNWLKYLSSLFFKKGKKIYLVGGCVRDFLQGDEPKDYDLTTNALPDEIISILKEQGYRLNLQGKAFGVIVAYRKDLPKDGVEIATFRQDLTYGRHPEVKVGVGIEDDVKRRDLTINSLFYDLEESRIVDLVGGIEDLKDGIIRMVGDPIERIKEDQLRVLRVVRFASRYGFKIDNATKAAILNYTDLSKVSPERIFEELLKSNEQAKSINAYFFLLKELNLLEKIFGKSKIGNPILCFNSFELTLSQILKDESSKDIEHKLINYYKFDRHLAKIITFFVSIKDLNGDNVNSFFKKKIELGINTHDLKLWLETNYKDKIKFLGYKPIHDTQKLIDAGFTNKKLGDKIKEIEKQNWESL